MVTHSRSETECVDEHTFLGPSGRNPSERSSCYTRIIVNRPLSVGNEGDLEPCKPILMGKRALVHAGERERAVRKVVSVQKKYNQWQLFSWGMTMRMSEWEARSCSIPFSMLFDGWPDVTFSLFFLNPACLDEPWAQPKTHVHGEYPGIASCSAHPKSSWASICNMQ